MKRVGDSRHLEVERGDDRSLDLGWEGWLPEGYDPPSPRWVPEGQVPEAADAPWAAMRYVVVDDLYDDGVLLISYMWPSLTAAGTLYFGDDPRLRSLPDDGAAWGNSAPGIPLVFRELRPAGEGAEGGVVPFELDENSAWMPRAGVQQAVNTARTGGDPSLAATAGAEEPIPALTRPLRIGDTFAAVIDSPHDVEVIATHEDPPTEFVALGAARLTDVTLQARTVARAAQVSALTKPKPRRQLNEEIEGSAAKASAWELEGDTEIPVEGVEPDNFDSDPRDAQPTV